MSLDNKIKILSFSTSTIYKNRGTPIRIRKLLENLSGFNDVDLAVFSMDENVNFSRHCKISNNRWQRFKELYLYVKNNKIDIVIGHTMTTWSYLLFLKLFTKAKIVLEFHGFMEEEARANHKISNFRYNWNKFLYSIFYRSCDLISTCSETARQILLAYNKNVIAIFGGVDLDIFNPNVKSKNFFKKEGITIGYAGNSRTYQGFNFLINTFKELLLDDDNFKLVALLSDADVDNYRDIANAKFFSNFKHEYVPSLLVDCDILVIPRPKSKVNDISFPSKLPEYMAMEKAIVASKTSDVHMIIKDGLDGLLYEPNNNKEFKACLLRLRDKNLRDKLGKNAYFKAKTELTWDKQTSILYKELIKLSI